MTVQQFTQTNAGPTETARRSRLERVIELVRQHAPGAAIAFNTTPMDCVEAARRWLR